MRSLIDKVSDIMLSISELDAVFTMATENEAETIYDIVKRAYAMGWSDHRNKTIETIKNYGANDDNDL